MTEDLAKQAVACKGWRWMPGMLGVSAKAGLWRVEQADLTALCGAGAGPASIHEAGVWLPDLDDPATLGCLLALVREAYGKSGIHARRIGASLWRVYDDAWLKRAPLGKGATEIEAIIAALEAAP